MKRYQVRVSYQSVREIVVSVPDDGDPLSAGDWVEIETEEEVDFYLDDVIRVDGEVDEGGRLIDETSTSTD